MNPEMEAAFQLETGADNPEAHIPMDGGAEMSPEVLAAMGVGMSAQRMAGNGPYQPTHVAPKTITKAQYKEQMMREDQGYPSNPDESAKVVELEGEVSQIKKGIEAILAHLGRQSPAPPILERSPTGGPGFDVRMMEPPEKSPTLLPTVLPESKERKVTLSDGRQISVPALSLGPASNNVECDPVVEVPDDRHLDRGDEGWDDVVEVIRDPEVSSKPVDNPSILAGQVVEFLREGDPHRFFRRHLSRVHRHVGYNGWDPNTKAEFDKRFKEFLNDRTFIENICKKILRMDFGHALADKHAASMVVATAGFTAFALAGLGD